MEGSGNKLIGAADCIARDAADGAASHETTSIAGRLKEADFAVLDAEIDAYLDRAWDAVLADMASLVEIPSIEDLAAAAPGAPFGSGPHQALDAALKIARRMGFDAHDANGYIGYADYQGENDTQVGIIGHVDVVPAGPGWTVEPYALTRRDDYLLGRGTSDDKGPLVVAMHAVNFWREKLSAQGKLPRYTIRLLFGANEETNMADVAYYRKNFADPAFLFTPDAEFPLGYGESGCCVGELASAPYADGAIEEIEGGAATNAVPGEAHAVVRIDRTVAALNGDAVARVGAADMAGESAMQGPAGKAVAAQAVAAALPEVPGIVATVLPSGRVRIDATGKSAHASTPELGKSAIALLVDYLLENGLHAPAERAFLWLEHDMLGDTSGAQVGIQAADQHFGDLSAVGGVISMKDGRIVQTLDCRYPTTITAQEIEQRLVPRAQAAGAKFEIVHDKKPFLMNPDSSAVAALMQAYNHVTGRNAKPFTMKGGTYARMFGHAVSFGPEEPGEETPDWVGGMHSPDEGVSEASLKRAFRIYVHAIGLLMEAEL